MLAQTPGGSLEFLSAARQTLLVAIKNDGQATTEQLAKETFLSPGAVRSHLLALEAQGLVTYLRVRSGPGRPRHVFRLTKNGERLFPQLYTQLANLLLDAVEAEGEAVVERVFGRLLAEQVEVAGAAVSASARPRRVLELVEFIARYGYFPRLEGVDSGSPSITLRHCPLLSVARQHPGLCEVECRAMRTVLPGASVVRTEHRLQGDSACTYVITWPEPEGD